jgi:hypothetical protein
MAFLDTRGNPIGSASRTAQEAAERALRCMLAFDDTPLADLDAAAAADPDWALPHIMKAGFLLGLTEASLLDEASAHGSHARTLVGSAPPRERAHLEAVQRLLEGRWHAASRIWDGLLLDHPRDGLALWWAHLWDFHRGDAVGLRQRPARALPDWDESDPLYPHILALHAFGLEESNLHPQAEEAGRRALSIDPCVPWAVHAVAHVMEMQGRHEDGAGWLRLHQPQWAEGNGFAAHLWWHKCLFRMEVMDLQGVRRLIDAHLCGDALQITLQRVDAASMLWRLHLLGEDVAADCAELIAAWSLGEGTAGHSAFNDAHAVMAMLGAGDVSRAEAWVARCAARALEAGDAGRANHQMAREVGLPLMRGLLAFARGDADAAVDLIYPVRARACAFGGSHAQRDLIDHTLLAAAANGSHRALGRALINERTMAKPVSPLVKHWKSRLSIAQSRQA